MLLEKHCGHTVGEGRVRYHQDNLTVRIPLDDEKRAWVARATQRARNLRSCLKRPPVTIHSRRCLHCSLAPVCLPEEERLAHDSSWEAVRLFPPHRDGLVLHILTRGTTIGRSGEALSVHSPDQNERIIPIQEIDSVVLHGYAQITTQAIHLLARIGIPVHWISPGGRYIAGLAIGTGGVQRKIRQYEALVRPEVRLSLARVLATARVESQIRYLLRASREDLSLRSSFSEAIEALRASLRGIANAADVDAARGHEGIAGRAWYCCLPRLLSAAVPLEMRPSGRNRRPPRDRFNALLSFGYSLLYASVLEAVLDVGLEPALGFFHTPRSSAHPLVLDIMELFRLPVWDIALIGSVNRRQWDPQKDFSVAGGQVWLSDEGRSKAIRLYEDRLQESWLHPVVKYSLSWARALELEVRLLEKEWSGQPGLFARCRLR
jgi:CRISPR-associated protein Cas1